MEPTEHLDVGKTVLLEHQDGRARGVIDSLGGRRVVVSAHVGRPFHDDFAPGVELRMVVAAAHGIYETPVTLAQRDDQTLVLVVEADSKLVQRRAYVRVEQPLEATCLLLDEDSNTFEPFDTAVRDVSGGGCAMDADIVAAPGSVVVSSFVLPGERPVVALGTVVASTSEDRVRLADDTGKLRIMFTHVTERDRDRLIAHILRVAVVRRR